MNMKMTHLPHITLGASALIAALFFGPTTDARAADVVVLKDGRRIEGTLRTDGKDWVEIVRTYGSIKIHREDIAKVIVDDESAIRQATLETAAGKGSNEDKLALAAHYEREGRNDLARAVYKEILADDPENERARHELGYRRVGGVWMTEDEANIASGLVPWKGRWVKPEDREKLIKEEIAQLELENKEREEKIAERRTRREERAARAREEKESEWRPVTAYVPRYDDYPRGYYDRGYGYGGYGYGNGYYVRRRFVYPYGIYVFGSGYGYGNGCHNNNLFTGYGRHGSYGYRSGTSVSGSYSSGKFSIKFGVNR